MNKAIRSRWVKTGAVVVFLILCALVAYLFIFPSENDNARVAEFKVETFTDSDYSLRFDGSQVNEEGYVEPKSLRGDIEVRITRDYFQVENIFFDKQDLLNSPFYKRKDSVAGSFVFSPTHNISPGVHTIQVVLSTGENKYIPSQEREIKLGYSPNFRASGLDKNFFAVPEDTMITYGNEAWRVVGNQIISTVTGNTRASLAIIYPLKRFTLSFRLKPMSSSGGISVYLLESRKRFVFADGDMCKISFYEVVANKDVGESTKKICLRKNSFSEFKIEKNAEKLTLYEVLGNEKKVLLFQKKITEDDDISSYIGFSMLPESGQFSIDGIKLE